ncbi:amidase [Rhodococcus wratislaviensis]|uniref:amidase n=1 Tax=Rhodococcus wratislaviensis NBRC 100605 TaxID=1219028 RepID=X0PXR5_RHOWR|nr:amidase [Rhodococcus wratislaviensis]GAF48309.1 putative amidase [Rhodococcus wratislaviensis NBRC 100605]
MTIDTQWLDATAQAKLVRAGQKTAVELVEDAIERINRLNPALNAVNHTRFDAARMEAEKLHGTAPFLGVPTLIKGLTATAGDPHDRGIAVLKERGITATTDGAIVRRFRAAGFVVVGRSAAPELGLVSTTESKAHGITRNPWRTDVTSGGSSGGASSAVAAGMVPAAHGGDGGGSIRMPAAFCHLVGLKVSHGLISSGPQTPDRWGHSVPGVLTRTVRDTAGIIDAVSGATPGDRGRPRLPDGSLTSAVSRDPGRLRIGYVSAPPERPEAVEQPVREAVADAALLLAKLGHDVEPAHPDSLFDPHNLTAFFDALSVTVAQAVDTIEDEVGRPLEADELDRVVRFWERRGREMSGVDLADALNWLGGLRARMGAWWAGGFDLLLCPVFASPAPGLSWPWTEPGGIQKSVDVLTFTAPFNSTGQPAISVPFGIGSDGRPLAIQLVAAYGHDDLLISVAAQIERSQPWAHLTPAAVAAVTA